MPDGCEEVRNGWLLDWGGEVIMLFDKIFGTRDTPIDEKCQDGEK